MENYKILLVDDLIENLKTIVSIFEVQRPEYTVFQTNNAKSALQIISQNQPDLIITDWDMPEMNGIEFIKALKNNSETVDIPVIMASGVNLSSSDLKTALNAGATDYIRKPIDPIELLARVHSVLKITDYHKKMLETKDQELTESALYLVKSNQFNIDITKKLNILSQFINKENNPAQEFLEDTIKELNNRINEDSWYRFNLSFSKVHKEFDKNLISKYPELTATDLKICAFVRLGMNNKDIASVLHQSPDSVKVSRSRLRKKLALDKAINLESFLANF